jgi:membrane-associated HD superfamily phosphohydrolase
MGLKLAKKEMPDRAEDGAQRRGNMSLHVENAVAPVTGRAEVARLISAIIHPIVFPLVTLGIALYVSTSSVPDTVRWVALALILTTVPVCLLVAFQVMRGAWTDLDVSVRRQRYLLYPFGLGCMLILALVYRRFDAPSIAIRITLAIVLANLCGALINLWYKVSAHASGAAICATALFTVGALGGLVGSLAALMVGWSRVELRRHTRGQVLLGWSVGIASTLVMLH